MGNKGGMIMSGNRDINQFKRDAKNFGKSLAGHIPGVGRVLGIQDTYNKGKKVATSAPKALNAVKRKAKTNVRRRIRRITRKRRWL